MSVTVEDDDPVVEPGVRLSVSALTIDEGGSGTFTVVLESNPDGNVIDTPSSNNAEEAVSPEDLTFDCQRLALTTTSHGTSLLLTTKLMGDTATIAHDGERLRHRDH